MLTYDELIDLTLIETGQYITGLETTMLKRVNIELLIRRELAIYSKYKPIRLSKQATLYDGKQFTEADGFIPRSIISIKYNDSLNSSTSVTLFGRPVYYTPVPFSYTNGVLCLNGGRPGIYNVDYFSDHIYENGKIATLDLNSAFVNLFIAKFMISVGRSRKAFLLNDLPVTMDADTMVSEGTELYNNTIEFIQETSRYDFSITKR